MATVLANSQLVAAQSDRHGSDPLSEAEANLVRAAALPMAASRANAKSSNVQTSSGGSSVASLAAADEPLLLLVERRLTEKGESEDKRLADVYAYDYSDDSLIHTVVDVETGVVRQQEVLRDVQLPLVESEIQRAARIVMSDPAAREGLESKFSEVTGLQLNDISDIDFKAFVFHADTLPAELAPDSAMCGLHRCAQMITYTRDNVSLDFSPIIDLSDGRITQILAR